MDAPTDFVGIGSIVNLIDSNSGENQRYVILGAWDSDPDNNILSYLWILLDKNYWVRKMVKMLKPKLKEMCRVGRLRV